MKSLVTRLQLQTDNGSPRMLTIDLQYKAMTNEENTIGMIVEEYTRGIRMGAEHNDMEAGMIYTLHVYLVSTIVPSSCSIFVQHASLIIYHFQLKKSDILTILG